MKKRILIAILLFILISNFYFIRSLILMSIYSFDQEQSSVMTEAGYQLKIPGGWSTKKKDWYPFVMTFNSNKGITSYLGSEERIKLSVYYNFGHFPLFQKSSSVYDKSSPYHSAFYGAYAIKQVGNEAFGLDNGQFNYALLGKIPAFDYERLVLKSLGAQDPFFHYTLEGPPEEIMVDQRPFERVYTRIETQSMDHHLDGFHKAYLQYGLPKEEEDSFDDLSLYGVMYLHHLADDQITLGLYAMATTRELLAEIEREFLQKIEMVKD